MPFKPKSKKSGSFSGIKPTLKRVPGEGPIPAKIMLIGERPGEQEAYKGRPFMGTAGRILDICLKNAGIDRKDIYITNLVKEYKDYAKPTPEEITQGEDELIAELLAVNPIVIGTLGTFATEWILGWDRANLDRNHGIPVRWTGRNPFGSNATVVPCYHPAAGLYSSDNFALTQVDLNNIAMVAEGSNSDSVSDFEDIFGRNVQYLEAPIHASGTLMYDQSPIAIDTEGSSRQPWCLTLSHRPGHSQMIRPPNSALFFGQIFLHNSLHDLGVLRAMGIEIGDDQFRDTMVWAYLLCLEPQGLKNLAWRHCRMEMMSYEEVIHEADYDKAMEFLLTVNAYEWPKAEPYTLIQGGVAKVKKPNSINQRVARILGDVRSGKVGKDDTPTDPRARWNKIDEYLRLPVVEKLGEMPEATLDDVPYQVAMEYACRDSDATLRIAPILKAKIDEMGLAGVSDIDHSIIPMIDRMQQVGIKLSPKESWDELEFECDQIMGKARYGVYQLTGCTINPDSGDQVADLLYGTLGITIPWMTDGGKRGSTIDKALESIREHRDVVDLVLDYREASKVKSSFIAPLRKIVESNGDGRVHCTFRITRVSSGRLAATNPNLLAIPVRSDLGKKIRERFIAADGRILGDWDLDQIEMRWMADESKDTKLCTIFQEGKVDIHRQTAAWTFGVPYDQVLTEQRYAAKRVGFGVITGITGHGLVDQMELARARRPDGEHWTEDDCDRMIEAWFDIYTGVRPYMEQCKDEAYETGMVRDRWGRIRYLPGIWSPIKSIAEEAGRQAHSHKIQAGAQGYMKIGMAQVWKYVNKPLLAEPLLQVYDSLLQETFDSPSVKVEVNRLIVGCLTETTKLSIPVKAKGSYGQSWAECKD